MDSKEDQQSAIIMMDASALDAPLLQVTHDEEALPSSPTTPQEAFAAADAVPSSNSNNNNTTIEVMDQVTCGEKQPDQYRDAAFAVLFGGHLVAISFFAFFWGVPAMLSGDHDDTPSYNNNNSDHDNIQNVSLSGILGICLLSTLAAVGIIFGALGVMIRNAEQLIQGSLIVSISFTLLIGVAFAVEGMVWISVVYFILFLLGVWYAYSVWHRIPFAQANLVTATTAIKSNLGIMAVAFGMVVICVVWVCVWILCWMGIYMHTRKCDDTTGDCDDGKTEIAAPFLLLSLYWTSEVIKNVLVVTTSGVVGTWWFAPHEAAHFWSPAIRDSLGRATSYSFGSICLGSLVMAVIQTLHHMVREARRANQRNSMLLCLLECVVACLERMAEYFNKFANIYIGLYGYDYLTAGKKVMELFMNRGWTTIINDQLVYRTLALMKFVVGALTGCVGMLLAFLIPSWVEALGDNQYIVAFLLPFLIGISMAHIVLGVVASATDTVIVCFAESPNDFQANYPELSQQMLLAWRQIYPAECGF